MISTDYDELLDACNAKGYSVLGLCALVRIMNEAKIYRFRRHPRGCFEYAVVMPGYGVMPKTKHWIDPVAM